MRGRRSLSEISAILKDPGGKLGVLLVFPNSYFVGMSNLGLHAIYASLNSLENVRCERAFLPDRALGRGGSRAQAPRSIESGQLPSQFDVIAFSIPFENDYPNAVRFLMQSGMTPLKDKRGFGEPLVAAGGCAVSANPEPMSAFVDAFFIGDGEYSVQEFSKAAFDAKQRRLDRTELLSCLSEIEGIYVPGLFEPQYSDEGMIAEVRALGGHKKVSRRLTSHERLVPARTVVFAEDTEFGHLGLIEAVRGCPRSCRFCMTGFCNRPARFLSARSIIECALGLKEHRPTIGLVGSAVADHPELNVILRGLLDAGLGVTVASLRADKITQELLQLLKQGGQRTITIAPEAGSEHLREALSKPCSDDMLIDVAGLVAELGFATLKLYFMVGLPGETQADIEGIVGLVKRMRHGVRKRSGGKRDLSISVSLSSFVPKAQTPFQWEAMMPPTDLLRRIKAVEHGLRGTRGVSVQADVPKWAFVQGVLSRGDRRCWKLVMALAETDFDWQASRQRTDVNPDFYAARPRPLTEVLPWAHIDCGVSTETLLRDLNSYRSEMKGQSDAPSD